MYSLNMPVSAVRTKVRQEFERHRYVQQLPVVDMLLFRSHSEYQVWFDDVLPCVLYTRVKAMDWFKTEGGSED